MLVANKPRTKSKRKLRAEPRKNDKLKIKDKENVSASYNRFKEHEGKFYTGMAVGRSHKWYYDKGEWKETKITPDLWRISYAVTKRRAGKAPQGSGAAVGTAYHWYILAHQRVEKLNANDYSTGLTGLKYKLAHKRAADGKWNVKTPTQRNHLIEFLKQWLHELEKEAIPLEFEHKGTIFKGEAVPLPGTCVNDVCQQFDVTLNDENIGIIRSAKSGWKIERVTDQPFVKAIAAAIMQHYDASK